MKTLYIECKMGAAGDMLTAALLEVLSEPDAFIDKMNGLNIPRVKISCAPAVKCGITGTSVTVTVDEIEEGSIDVALGHKSLHGQCDHDFDHTFEGLSQYKMHEHDGESAVAIKDAVAHGLLDHDHDYDDDPAHPHYHRNLAEISSIIGSLAISDKVKSDALAVYGLIAGAEAAVHGMPIDQIHFHEVGTIDAVADIVGVCLLIEELGAEKIIVSPVHVGSGQVQCAHGVLPVPAPATAYILRDVPCYGGSIEGELCTPTGAALLKHFADEFGAMPIMTTERIGYGMGKKDFPSANCVRVFMGES